MNNPKSASAKKHTLTKHLTVGQINVGKVAPFLAPKGINSANFVKEFESHPINKDAQKGDVVTAKIAFVPGQKDFSFVVKSASVSQRLFKILGIQKGASSPGRESVASINVDQVLEVAKSKFSEITNNSLFGMCKSVIATARSNGIKFDGDIEDLRKKAEADKS